MGVHEVGSTGRIGNARIPLPEIRRAALREQLVAISDRNKTAIRQLADARSGPSVVVAYRKDGHGILLIPGAAMVAGSDHGDAPCVDVFQARVTPKDSDHLSTVELLHLHLRTEVGGLAIHLDMPQVRDAGLLAGGRRGVRRGDCPLWNNHAAGHSEDACRSHRSRCLP